MTFQPIVLALIVCGWLPTWAADAAEDSAATANTATISADDVAAPGPGSAGAAKAATCMACHGANGNSVNPIWPSLAGQHRQYIVEQLQAYKNDERVDPLMTPMAKTLSEADMEDLGAYYAAQTPSDMQTAPAKVAEGQRLYRGGEPVNGIAACTACHGPAGAGNPAARYPSIRGQQSAYLAAQLKNYRAGTRTTDHRQNQMMRNVAAKLSDAQIEAVAAYVQGLR